MHVFNSKAALVAAAAEHLAGCLKDALRERGEASVMLSGGSSPKPVYEAFAQADLAWDGVGVGLVDERWVPSGVVGSNGDFIQDCFRGTAAERAFFVPMHNDAAEPSSGLEAAEQVLALLPRPFDVCVMGLGLDGHTASWFPNSRGLDVALDPESPATVAAIDAVGSTVAGDHTKRMTLTYSAIAKAGEVLLLLPSAEKTTVFHNAKSKPVTDAPVKALLDLGDRLTVFAMETG